LRKTLFVLILFLCAGCSHRRTADLGASIDPLSGSGSSSELEEELEGAEPVKLIDNDLSDYGSNTDLEPVFFRYDAWQIESDQISVLQSNAKQISRIAMKNLLIEGHCDERGTEEYNLALGERRAKAAKDYLVELGVDPVHIRTISYGESRPFEKGHNEAAWSSNRRAQFVKQ
jgi:peptidoglycan-associated lipoprotein